MNKQVEQIRAEVYRRFVEAGIHEGMIAETREDELNSLLSFIDSMGEDRPEPISPADVGFEALGKVWDENAKKESGKLTQSVTKTSDQVMPVSDDLEKEIDRWSKEQCYNKSEKPAFAAVARHFAQWQKQQIMKDAVDIIPFDINPNYGIACFWIEKQSGEVLKIESSWLISQGIEVNKKIKLITIKEDLI